MENEIVSEDNYFTKKKKNLKSKGRGEIGLLLKEKLG